MDSISTYEPTFITHKLAVTPSKATNRGHTEKEHRDDDTKVHKSDKSATADRLRGSILPFFTHNNIIIILVAIGGTV